MNYHSENNTITLSALDSFDIEQTLECGQCFRFTKVSDHEYIIIAFSKKLRISQHNGVTDFYPCGADEFEKIWIPYFDLDRDYSAIKDALAADPVMSRAIAFAGGIRILSQDPWECLLSFIISQNMNIPRIKKLIQALAERYGDCREDFYAFPSVEQILPAGVSGLTECRTGFRAKYLFDAITKVSDGSIVFSDLNGFSTAELKSALTAIYGVGDKVADCVSLFAFGRHEVFPMDVWVRRAMQELYFGGREVRHRDAYAFAQDKFGTHAGIAQQYLFHYMRNLA